MRLLLALGRFDNKIFLILFNHSALVRARGIAKIISKSGDGYLHILIPIAFLLFVPAVSDELLPLFITSILVERCVYFCLKNILKRRRPSDFLGSHQRLLTPADKFSFPSGHSSAAFLLATVICLTTNRLELLALMWASAVGMSRVILGVHYPGDVVAGMFLGILIPILTSSIILGY